MNKLMTLSALSAAALVFGFSDSANADHSRNSRLGNNRYTPLVGRTIGNRYDSCTPNFTYRRPRFSISIGGARGVWRDNDRGFNRRGFDRYDFGRRDFNRGGFNRSSFNRRSFGRNDRGHSRHDH